MSQRAPMSAIDGADRDYTPTRRNGAPHAEHRYTHELHAGIVRIPIRRCRPARSCRPPAAAVSNHRVLAPHAR
jgi:hypothetical protein